MDVIWLDGWAKRSMALNWCNSCKDAQLENPSRSDPIQLLRLRLRYWGSSLLAVDEDGRSS